MAAQKSHVPKFGNWDGDNVPYTAYFENARKEKANGVMINPNDPQENPEAFNFKGTVKDESSNLSHGTVWPPFPSKEKRFHKRNTSDQQKSVSYKSPTSISSSEKSPSDTSAASVLNPRHRRKRSDYSKFMSDSQIPASPGPNRLNCADDFSSRSVSIPKFGEWEEKDPRVAEGFTVIFNKVKEEKQIAAAKFSPVPLQAMKNYQPSPKNDTRSKRCCCLF